MITDYTRSTRLCVSQAFGWSPLHIWCPVSLLCLLHTLFCTSQEYSLYYCLSILDYAYVQSQFLMFLLALQWHYNFGYSFAKVQNLLLVNISAEMLTEFNGWCCQLIFVINIRICYVQYLEDFFYCVQFTACYFVVYRNTLIYNESCHVWHIYTNAISCSSHFCLKLLSRC